MKTIDIVLIGGGVALLGYLAYKNKDKFVKPLTDSDNQPLRAGFDTGTNNGQGYQTEEEKPASDPVVLSSTPKNELIKQPTNNTFETGAQPSLPPPELDEKIPIPAYYTTTPYADTIPLLKPLVAEVSPSAPVVSITATPEQQDTLLYNNSPKNIDQGYYDYGLAVRPVKQFEAADYAQIF